MAMNSVAQRSRPLWLDTAPRSAAPPLAENLRTDVVIVGAGIAGLSIAYLLARAGQSVIVLDAGPIGGGMTARTTAHLSAALDDRYGDLIALRGVEDARLAAESHAAAITLIEQIQDKEEIACDFARVDGFLFNAAGGDADLLARELDAARRVGLVEVGWADRAPMRGMDTGRCLRFPRMGRLHPLKYVDGLVRAVTRDGGRLFTARVVAVTSDGTTVVAECEQGQRVSARAGVVATNSPINDRLTIHTKQAPYRSYVVAMAMPRGAVGDALCWDTGDPYHYTRLQPGDVHDTLIVGGEDHKSGQAADMDARLVRLEAWTRERFPEAGALTHRWSGQVLEPVDYVGFIGRNPGDADNVYVATGDSGMGMTHGTIAGMLISDQILGRENRWMTLYDPARLTVKASGEFVAENLNVAAQFAGYVTGGDVASLRGLKPGEGAIVRRGLRKLAVYRDEDGVLHERSAICTHVGCMVAWNPLEGCWDCPCHGSQFAADGTPINGPAFRPLAPAERD
jgi:glycine/D-amino acid oxidase-like deaminating enzyme/nitrite reductase/ring-hydroxylating ferredoxin subunit